MMLEILYQDQYLVAINKPAGMLVHRSLIDKHETQFAMQILRDQIGQHVFPVHRLDKPTSGVLVFALSSEIARALTEQLTQKSVGKVYHAIVRGYAPDADTIDYALKEKLDKIADKKAKANKPAQAAVTDFTCLHHFELPFAVGRYSTARYSLLRLNPRTGRKHQLRRHMAHIRHPIVGDTTHGDGKQNAFVREQFAFKGLALTCSSMSVIHPVEQKTLTLRSHLDQRMANLLKDWGMTSAQINQITKE